MSCTPWVWLGLVVPHPGEQQEAGQGPLHGAAAMESSAAAGLKEIILSCFTADSWNAAGSSGHQMGEGAGSTPRNSATAGRCPAVDLSSDTIYLECRVPQNCWGRQRSRLAPVPREQAGWSRGRVQPIGSHSSGAWWEPWRWSQGAGMGPGKSRLEVGLDGHRNCQGDGGKACRQRNSSMHLGLQDNKGQHRKKLKVW